MVIQALYDRYDARVRAMLSKAGIDGVAQDVSAKNIWSLMAAYESLPVPVEDCLFMATRHETIASVTRDARRRWWKKAIAEIRRAEGESPFDAAYTIERIRSRLSDRDDEILIHIVNCRTDDKLREQLGYIRAAVAQSVRARIMTRLEQVLQGRPTVSSILNSFAALHGIAHAGVVVTGLSADWPEPNEFAVRASVEWRDRIFSHIARIKELARGTSNIEPGVLGSFAALFAAASGEITEWSEVLGIHAVDVALLRSGELSVVEIQPTAAVVLARMLRVTVTDFIELALGDLGFRPVRIADGRPFLREPLMPRDEVELRIRAIQSAAAQP